MPDKKLAAALKSVDWNANVAAFVADNKSAKLLAEGSLRLAIWAKQLETHDQNNPALCFIREMQVAGHQVAALTSLALYKSAAGAMRSMLETALYYSYFRTHPAELTTLARSVSFYLEKQDILDYHKQHSPDFVALQGALGVVSRLQKWYRLVSSIIHGQIPGKWVSHKSISEIKPIKPTQDIVIGTFVEGVDIVHRFFLCTVGRELWDGFSTPAKKQLLSGLHGDEKKALQLDIA
jgi:hypothetical protein